MRQARLETNIQELERPSSRLQEHARQETLRELEFVKNVRKEGVNEDEFTVEGMGQHDFRTNSPDNKVVKFSEVITTKTQSDNLKINTNDSHWESKSNKFNQISNINKQKERARYLIFLLLRSSSVKFFAILVCLISYKILMNFY